jgi:hypothetical protein
MNRVINRVMYRVKYDSILGIAEISQYLQHNMLKKSGFGKSLRKLLDRLQSKHSVQLNKLKSRPKILLN